jgi:coproporphyrinogen III oxidase-like Fe-S oxidoreductase
MKTSLYIHIPYCLSKCEYCDFFSVKCSQIDDFYVRSLCNEIESKAKFFNISQKNMKIVLTRVKFYAIIYRLNTKV